MTDTAPGESAEKPSGEGTPHPFPYDRPGYADGYDSHYNLSRINRPHFDFECETVAALVDQLAAERGRQGGRRELSWLDLACGTGLHLRTVRTPHRLRRTGVDRSSSMLAVARADTRGAGITWTEADVRSLPADARHDLVTALWYGYLHQPDLNGVRAFIEAAAAQVAAGGSFLLGLCNPIGVFETMPHETPMVYGAPMTIDAVVWSFTERWEGDRFVDCIAPHPDLIRRWIGPLFRDVELLNYPPPGVPDSSWRRTALLFVDRGSARGPDDH